MSECLKEYFVSIDVGMKNLAFCLFKCESSVLLGDEVREYTYEIERWDVINLCDEHICGCIIPGGNCKKKPYYVLVRENKQSRYCKKCAKELHPSKILPDKFKKPLKDLKKVKVKELKDIVNELGIKPTETMNGDKKIKLKKQDYIDMIENEINDKYLNFYYPKNANNYTMVEYAKKIKEKLPWHIQSGCCCYDFDEVGYGRILHKGIEGAYLKSVVIENQIGPKALRMKTLQGMITQHFIEHGEYTDIYTLSAANKLKDYITGKTTYQERKKESVKITRKLLNEKIASEGNEEDVKWLNEFNKHSKKDDLADCFLQGIYFIKHINGRRDGD